MALDKRWRTIKRRQVFVDELPGRRARPIMMIVVGGHRSRKTTTTHVSAAAREQLSGSAWLMAIAVPVDPTGAIGQGSRALSPPADALFLARSSYQTSPGTALSNPIVSTGPISNSTPDN
ncbi:hypothetical protein KM043_012552 [Ampulex compressa]|nr:hypothetical protein KM043_012552 [Ampulex compressa]